MYRNLLFFFTACIFASAARGQKGLVEYELRKGYYGSNPSGFTHIFNKLFFTAFTDGDGYQTWYCDGANAPVMLNSMGLTVFGTVNGKLYLTKRKAAWLDQYDLYEYDGVNTPAFVTPLQGAADTIAYFTPMPINGKLYFRMNVKTPGPVYSTHIKSFDPATAQVKTEYTLPAGGMLDHTLEFQGKIYFTGNTPAEGVELHVFDPATGSASLVADINPGNKHAWPEYLKVVDNMLFFRAEEAVYSRELYMYDGQNPPKRLTDINPGAGYGVHYSSPVSLNGNIYFLGHLSGNSEAIYKYEPATGNISLACDVSPGKNPFLTELAVYGDKLYFGGTLQTGIGVELMSYDFVNPPVIVADAAQSASAEPRTFVHYNNSLYFIGNDQGAGWELYKYTDSAVSVEPVQQNIELSLYPNPASDKAVVEWQTGSTGKLRAAIVDINGREVYTSGLIVYRPGKQTLMLDLGALVAGNYTCILRDEAGRPVATQKLSKL